MSSTPPGRKGAMRGGLWLAASNLIPLAATMLLSVLMGRVLGPEELGTQGYIAYVAGLLTSLVVTVITTMSFRILGQAHGQDDAARTRTLFQWTVIGQVVGSVLVTGTLLLFGSMSSSAIAWLLAALNVLVDGFFWSKATYLVASRGWSTVARSRLLSQTSAALMGMAAILLGAGINGVFLANLIAATGLLIWVTPKVPFPAFRPLSAFPRDLVPIWGAFFVLGALSQIVSYRIEFIFLDFWATKTELAMYSIAFMAVSTAVTLPTSIIGAAMPAVAAQEGAGRLDEAAASLGSALRILAITGCLLTAGVASLAPALISLAYGPDFLPAANLVPLLATGIVATTCAMLCWSFLEGSGRTRFPMIAASFAAVVDITVAWMFVGSLGATGAAMANVSAQYTLLFAILYLTWREFGRFRLGLSALAGRVLVTAIIGLGCMWIVRTLGYDTAGESLRALLVGGVVFASATLAFGWTRGFIRGQDALWLRAAMPSGPARFLFLMTGRRGAVPADPSEMTG